MTSTPTHQPPRQSPRQGWILAGKSLVHGYGKLTVLHGVDCVVSPGESIVLTGPSGSGKTTLLHLLAGIHTPWQGQVNLAPAPTEAARKHPDAGGDVAAMNDELRSALRRSRFGLVFQSGQLLDELTAEENVALPLLAGGVNRHKAVESAQEYFAMLGLDGLQARRPGEVSGGQRQRIALARALVTRPDVLFADEPTGALDSRTGAEVMDAILVSQRRTGAALVMVTHDADMAARCGRTLKLRDGRIESESGSARHEHVADRPLASATRNGRA